MTTNAAAVRRPLHLGTPLTAGDDVRALQNAMQVLFDHYDIDWLPLAIDGQVGPQTIHAARFLTWVIGLGKGHREPIQKRKVITKATQHLLRNPEDRSRLERRREKSRRKRLARIRHNQSKGPDHAVDRAEAWVGLTEMPPGSNSGPNETRQGEVGGITFWEKFWGLTSCFWCLVWACFFLKEVGGMAIEGNCVNAGEIERNARAHRDGWVAVPWEQRRRGDVILCNFEGSIEPDHGELCRNGEGGEVTHDVGGNTSFESSGSQSNGGAVAFKDRPRSVVTCVARPLQRQR